MCVKTLAINTKFNIYEILNYNIEEYIKLKTYEIENINSKYLILLDTFIKCKYIRVYPIKYYITKEINGYIYIINNEDSMQFFNTSRGISLLAWLDPG